MVGNTHTVKINRAGWITVGQAHDGIVTREEFDQAQAAMREFEEYDASARKPFRARKVICGICGHAMARSKGANAFYSCHTSRVAFDYLCTEEPVPEADIQELVLADLRIQAAVAVEMERIWAELHQSKAGTPANARKKISVLNELQAQHDRKLKELYEGFILGETSKSEYLAAKKSIVKSREDISAQIEEVRFCLNNTDADGHLQNRFITCFQQYKDTETLTTEIVDNVLEKILVYPGGRLEVHWNYREEFEKLVSDLNLGGDSDE